jgi:phosphoenolpyruvate carboxykinase (GTP)
MLILGVESPEGETTYVAAAFPSACGKTNFAMMIPPASASTGWKVWTVGDDIAWMRVGADGRLWAINPESGYFGVAPGTSMLSNPNAMATVRKDTIFTNVAITPTATCGGRASTAPPRPSSPTGRAPVDAAARREGGAPELALHRADGATTRALEARRRPAGRADLRDHLRRPPRHHRPAGAAVVQLDPRRLPRRDDGLGDHRRGDRQGRRGAPRPDGHAARSAATTWATTSRTGYACSGSHLAAAEDLLGQLVPPASDGKFLWPGFGENMRVLKWIVDRARGRVGAAETVIGWVPRLGDLDLQGINVSEDDVAKATRVDYHEWKTELESQAEFFAQFGERIPRSLLLWRELLLARLQGLPS